jgi:hypothetical protein
VVFFGLSFGTDAVMFGGSDCPCDPTIEMYNLTTGVWTSFNMSVGRCQAAAAVVGNVIAIAGGYVVQPSFAYSNVTDFFVADIQNPTLTTDAPTTDAPTTDATSKATTGSLTGKGDGEDSGKNFIYHIAMFRHFLHYYRCQSFCCG